MDFQWNFNRFLMKNHGKSSQDLIVKNVEKPDRYGLVWSGPQSRPDRSGPVCSVPDWSGPDRSGLLLVLLMRRGAGQPPSLFGSELAFSCLPMRFVFCPGGNTVEEPLKRTSRLNDKFVGESQKLYEFICINCYSARHRLNQCFSCPSMRNV